MMMVNEQEPWFFLDWSFPHTHELTLTSPVPGMLFSMLSLGLHLT
jgi:hypothetical protein